MADQRTYNSVQLRVVRDETQQAYLFGAVLDGVFVPFASRKLGGVDADLARAREQAAQDQAQSQASPGEQPEQ